MSGAETSAPTQAPEDDTRQTVKMVRLFGAWQAGKAAARLRAAGHSCIAGHTPDQCGAFQWADAAGFGADHSERSTFAQSFVAELTTGRRR